MHHYADDCQLYVSTPVNQVAAAVSKLAECVTDVNDWLSRSKLGLNASKTQVIWLGSRQQLDKLDFSNKPIMSNRVPVSETVRDLGVIFDRRLTICRTKLLLSVALWLLSAAAAALGRTVVIGTWRRGSCPCLHFDLIIATPCFLVSTTVCSSDCSQSRMLPRAWLPARGDVNTSRQY